MFLNKSLEAPFLQCELCKNVTPKQNVHVCESGHTICINCDGSDCEHNYDSSVNNANKNNIKNNKTYWHKDFAGGITNEGNDNIKLRNINSKEKLIRIMYKKRCYDDCESSVQSCTGVNSETDTKKIIVRPIICPVDNCQKTVALDSIQKHFAFDHSKIPTLPIDIRKTLKIYLKLSNLSSDTRCIAIIYPVGVFSPFLLMAAKIRNSHRKHSDEKKFRNQLDSPFLPQSKYKDERCRKNKLKEHQDDIILWICKLNDVKQIYSITVKKDNILGYTYFGEGLHIQYENHDPVSVYKSSEYLTLRRHAIEKLLDDKQQIHVYLNITK